jgi:hypothetical protein
MRTRVRGHEEFNEELNHLLNLAKDNDVPREELKRVLKSHANYLESDRGKEEFASSWELGEAE